ncbi:magnesium transporter [Anaerococcus sp. AGMB00486]|uniref:Magnesium transporter MgtE n=2 Tax=Anaerococcus TaxID=165779 RepID=A0ABX2NAR9_9FIRM|nr:MULTISPECIES: magnesium transporter [Anaerococcus]MDY3006908.1 magnesium transporter [Anaerococcus porci]MSS78516.1 magnesium transporter [Anaerococcus porci]NVF11760.1 magnesium transporter [Anaerococcus faecalis]
MESYNSEQRIAELEELLRAKDIPNLKDSLRRTNPVDIEEFMSDLDNEQSLIVFRLLRKDDAAEVFAELKNEGKHRLLTSITDPEIDSIVNALNFDDVIDTLEEMPATVVKRMLKNSDAETRKKVNEFLQFPEDSAGSLMTTEFVEVKPEMTCKEVLDRIKKVGSTKVTIYTCYVTSKRKSLLGYVSLRLIVTSDSDTKVKDLMYEDVISVEAYEDQEEVAKTFMRYGFTALPVVDSERRLIGIITVDDIMDVMELEATEDFQRMAAITPDEEEYSTTSAFKLAKNRLPWLMFLMISASFTSTILKSSQQVIESIIALNMFIPMLTDSGGNAGSQSSTLVIRGMATGDVELKDWYKVVFKELQIGLMIGLVMAIVAFGKCMLFDKVGSEVSLIVALTIFIIIVIAKVVGALLPMGAKKIGFDPAIMASPLITTIVDSIGLLCYFEVAKIIMGI